MNLIPEKVVNYNLYNNTEKLIGVNAEVTIPNLEPLTETVAGAGLLGEWESVSQGHFGSLALEIGFRHIGSQAFALQEMKDRMLVLRAAQQSYDVSSGVTQHRGLKISMKGQPKGINPGKIAANANTETTVVYEVVYLKIEEDGKVLLELDKLNFVYILNGFDQLSGIRNLI